MGYSAREINTERYLSKMERLDESSKQEHEIEQAELRQCRYVGYPTRPRSKLLSDEWHDRDWD